MTPTNEQRNTIRRLLDYLLKQLLIRHDLAQNFIQALEILPALLSPLQILSRTSPSTKRALRTRTFDAYLSVEATPSQLFSELLDAFLDGIGLEVTLDDVLLCPLGEALA